MPLPFQIDTLDSIPEPARGFYQKDSSGQYILDVQDNPLKPRIDKFRAENIAQRKQLEELGGKLGEFQGLDPAKARAALEKLTQIEEKNLMDAGKFEELFVQRTEAMRQDYSGQITAKDAALKEAQESRATLTQQLSGMVVDQGIQGAIAEFAAVRAGAMADVIARARQTWKLNGEGKPEAFKDGQKIYGKDGANPLTMTEYAQRLVTEAPHLFESTTGGGAPGSSSTPTGLAGNVIQAGDQEGFSNHLEDIAAGKMTVNH